jgi:hypothetical protein
VSQYQRILQFPLIVSVLVFCGCDQETMSLKLSEGRLREDGYVQFRVENISSHTIESVFAVVRMPDEVESQSTARREMTIDVAGSLKPGESKVLACRLPLAREFAKLLTTSQDPSVVVDIPQVWLRDKDASLRLRSAISAPLELDVALRPETEEQHVIGDPKIPPGPPRPLLEPAKTWTDF